MQNATNLDVKENGKPTRALPCDALQQLFLRIEGKLTSIHPRGGVLFAEGQAADGIYLLRSGRAKVSISSAEGKTVILRVEQAGALLGLNAILEDVPHNVTVESLEHCQVDFVSRSDFMKLLDRSEPAIAGVVHTLANELSDVVERVRSLLLSHSAAEKLGRLLLKWCDEQGDGENEEVRVNPGLTQEEIAQMICASRETVSRLFADLKRKQIVSTADNAIFVHDRNALESLACC